MPSALAHGLVGAALSSVLPRERRSASIVFALVILAAAPDLDVLAFGLGIPYGHPLGHRGLTHSLCFAAAFALASTPIWQRVLRADSRIAPVLTFLAVASHGVLDTFTDAGLGVGLLIPFDDTRYFAPWRPIETSPLSVRAFLSARGLEIVANEAVWVGLPSAAFVVSVAALRRHGGRQECPSQKSRTATPREPDA